MQRHTSKDSYEQDVIRDIDDNLTKEERSFEISEDYKVEVYRCDPYGSKCSNCRRYDINQYIACKKSVALFERIEIANSLKNE